MLHLVENILAQVTEPGISEHPIWAIRQVDLEKRAEARVRRTRMRAESFKRRIERERTAPIERVGRLFKAQHGGRCAMCHGRFDSGTMIAKSTPKGYVHVDCGSPQVVIDKQLTASRSVVRDAIAASRFNPREASPS